jgi:exonuclease III
MRYIRSLTILQYNVNKSKDRVMLPFLQALNPKDHHIIAVQEPWRNPRVQDTAKHPGYHTIYPPTDRTRTCFYVSRDIDPGKWHHTIHSPDLITVTINSDIGPIHIHNCYNPPPGSYTSQAAGTLPLLPSILHQDGEHILVGDFNLHHPLWGGIGSPTQHTVADALIEHTAEAGLSLALPQGSITWETRGASSTIDLVFASESIHQRILHCAVDMEREESSDHLPIRTTLDTQPPPNTTKPKRPQWKRADWERTRLDLEARLLPLQQEELEAEEDLDRYTERIQEAINTTIQTTIPAARPSKWATMHWTQECSAKVQEARAARRKWTREGTEEAYQAYRTAANSKKRQIRSDKTKAWRRTAAELAQDPRALWRLAKWARTAAKEPAAPPQFPPLRDGNGTLHADNGKKAAILAERFYPPPREADLSDIPQTTYPPPVNISQEVTVEVVTKALKRLPPDKAPGPDAIPNRFLKECRAELAQPLQRLFQRCLDLGYHPKQYKTSTTVVLRKPQKPDYSSPKAFRPIALLNTMGKLLEWIVADKISTATEEHRLLPDMQIGARRNRSSIVALELLTEQIHTVWAQGPELVASVLSLDISGAYDHVSHERLLHNLKMARLPE